MRQEHKKQLHCYCILCGKIMETSMERCCTENSGVPFRKKGFLFKTKHFYTSDNQELDKEALDSLWKHEYYRLLQEKALITKISHHSDSNRRSRVVCFSPKSDYLAVGWDNGEVSLHEFPQASPIETRLIEDKKITALTFSSDGEKIACLPENGSLVIWEWRKKKIMKLETFRPYKYPGQIAFSPNSDILAIAGCSPPVIDLYDPNRGEQICQLKGHGSSVVRSPFVNAVKSIAFSPNNSSLVSGADDAQVIIWDLRTKKPQRILPGHNYVVNHVVYSPDGKKIISISRTDYPKNSKIFIWNAESGAVQNIIEFDEYVRPGLVTYLPDSKSTILWDQTLGKLECSIQNGNLSKMIETGRLPVDSVFEVDGGRQIVSGYSEHNPEYSPDASRFAFMKKNGDIDIYDMQKLIESERFVQKLAC